MIHLTINTGNSRQSPRSEVSAETLHILVPHIRLDKSVLPGGHWAILTDRRTPGCTAVSIMHNSADALRHVATVGVAWTDDGAAKIWSLMQSLAMQHRIPVRCVKPQSPSASVILLPDATLLPPDDLMQMGDLGRCLAWAVMSDQPGQ